MLNCIRQMSGGPYRHLVISLTHATEFASQLPKDVAVYCLDKKPGADLGVHLKLLRLLRETRPDILHSYNLATLEYHPVAWLAGVKGHLHAEHGRDVSDPQGLNKKYQWLRRLLSPFVQQFVAVSDDLASWLKTTVRLPARKVSLIHNGINTSQFVPGDTKAEPFTFIHVARLSAVKNQALLLEAAALLRRQTTQPWQLWLVGDGGLRQQLSAQHDALGLGDTVQFLGERTDIAALMAQAQVFVLSSDAEGIPMTVLEAMSAGLAIVSTCVGGLPELVSASEGQLVPPRDASALSTALLHYLQQPDAAAIQGRQARQKVCGQFSEQAMVAQYESLYRQLTE